MVKLPNLEGLHLKHDSRIIESLNDEHSDSSEILRTSTGPRVADFFRSGLTWRLVVVIGLFGMLVAAAVGMTGHSLVAAVVGMTDLFDSGHFLFHDKHGVPGMPEESPLEPCGSDEERFAFFCYKKCSALTNGTHPIRIAPMACCSSKPCFHPTEFHKKLTVKGFRPCSGYFVGGKKTSGCPHPYGTCYANEEFFLGLCYQKCSILTNGGAPIRFGTNTCCTKKPCWNPLHLRSQGAGCHGYNVAGGPAAGSCPHQPVNPNADHK